jgi:hypothetical protein
METGSKPISPAARLRKNLPRLWPILEPLLLLVLIACAIASLTELAGRKQLQTKIAEKYTELAEAHFRQSDLAVSNAQPALPDPELKHLRKVRDSLESLTTNGSWSSTNTQARLRWRLTNIFPTSESSGVHDMDPEEADIWAKFKNSVYPPWMDNSSLLAVLIISCGALGTLAAGLRTREPASFRQFFLGVATGFICFLLFGQGNFPLLKSAHGSAGEASPVASALFSLLAGMFSKHAYFFLGNLFKKMTGQVNEEEKPGSASHL